MYFKWPQKAYLCSYTAGSGPAAPAEHSSGQALEPFEVKTSDDGHVGAYFEAFEARFEALEAPAGASKHEVPLRFSSH